MITKPTLEDIVQLNNKAMRRLELLAQPSERNGARFLDSLGRIIDAKPVDFPDYVNVTSNVGNFPSGAGYDSQSIPKRPYEWRRFNLTKEELQLVLGLDYESGGPLTRRTSIEELNAMWKTNTRYSSRFCANAYVLGLVYNQSGSHDCIVPVQYYCINSRKHRELRLPKREFEELR